MGNHVAFFVVCLLPINLLSGVGYVEQYGASPKQIIADYNRGAYLHIGFLYPAI